MKIALIIFHADRSRGGAERYTLDLASALSSRGHAVSVICTSATSEKAPYELIQLDSGGLTRTSRYRRFLQSLEMHRDRNRYDVVHAMLPVPRCDLYHPHAGLAAAALRGSSWLNRLVNSRPAAFARVEDQLLHGIAKPPVILCLSEQIKREIRRFYPLADDRLKTLFNAVDLDRFQPEGAPQGPKINALIVAQDFERKGVREAIEAVARVNDERLHLTVVGKPSPDAYLRIAQNLKIANRVTFAGASDDVRPFYANADFFVLPTHHDPCSLVVLESLAMGVPVITTACNGASEVMTSGVHGFITNSASDIDALSKVMHEMLDPQRRTQMRAECLLLREKLSFQVHVDRLLEIYEHR
jgi:UDP-glucose:(heptosyl)LPS alpha-1,3-glucosyltransferase